jgi:hypothetical protein
MLLLCTPATFFHALGQSKLSVKSSTVLHKAFIPPSLLPTRKDPLLLFRHLTRNTEITASISGFYETLLDLGTGVVVNLFVGMFDVGYADLGVDDGAGAVVEVLRCFDAHPEDGSVLGHAMRLGRSSKGRLRPVVTSMLSRGVELDLINLYKVINRRDQKRMRRLLKI